MGVTCEQLGLADIASHVIGCHVAQGNTVLSAVDDVAGSVCQDLPPRAHWRRLGTRPPNTGRRKSPPVTHRNFALVNKWHPAAVGIFCGARPVSSQAASMEVTGCAGTSVTPGGAQNLSDTTTHAENVSVYVLHTDGVWLRNFIKNGKCSPRARPPSARRAWRWR